MTVRHQSRQNGFQVTGEIADLCDQQPSSHQIFDPLSETNFCCSQFFGLLQQFPADQPLPTVRHLAAKHLETKEIVFSNGFKILFAGHPTKPIPRTALVGVIHAKAHWWFAIANNAFPAESLELAGRLAQMVMDGRFKVPSYLEPICLDDDSDGSTAIPATDPAPSPELDNAGCNVVESATEETAATAG